jgi:hypothetical protein
VSNAEEVAFNDPPAGMAEQMILNQHLYRLLRHTRLSAFQQFVQQVRPTVSLLSASLSCFSGVRWTDSTQSPLPFRYFY